jgi:hypothetical protein
MKDAQSSSPVLSNKNHQSQTTTSKSTKLYAPTHLKIKLLKVPYKELRIHNV